MSNKITRGYNMIDNKENEKYNGWTNWNTWALHLNITNDYHIYEYFKNIESLDGFIKACQLYKSQFYDKTINLKNCNFLEVFNAVSEVPNKFDNFYKEHK
jgi:hypothetical protein